MKFFISFQQSATRWATWIEHYLSQAGHSCYIYTTSDRPGDLVWQSISDNIESSDYFLALLSESYLASEACKREYVMSYNRDYSKKEKRTVGILLEKFDLPVLYDHINHLNFVDVAEEEARRQLADLIDPKRPDGVPAFPGKNSALALEAAPAEVPLVTPLDTTPTDPTPPFPSQGSVTEAFQDFMAAVKREEQRVKAADKQVKDDARPNLPLRVPNFLLLLRDDKLVLAICDEKTSVNVHALQPTGYPEVTARMAKAELLPQIGFDKGFIHPMFYDETGIIDTIIVDSNLFFQFLYFPRSDIQLPSYEDGSQTPVIASISAFMRTLKKFHGENKVMYSNIAQKSWPDDILLGALKKRNIFTRFAPTPSRGLHVGNVRSGLIPYLMYRSDIRRNNFLLRFDDTNQAAVKERFVAQIREELEWLGWQGTNWFRESEQRSFYQLFLDLLKGAGYTVTAPDGSISLNEDHPDLDMVYWLDINRGPTVIHKLKKVWSTGGRPDLTLTTENEKSLKYKFCGAIDDLLLSSHVVRDIRQEPLTARQAMIRYAIYRAWQTEELSHPKKIDELRREIETWRKSKVPGSVPPPLPFMAPPIYCHVVNVADDVGKILRKRAMLPNSDGGESAKLFAIDGYQRTGLPEAVVAHLISTIVPRERSVSPQAHRLRFTRMAGQVGVQTFLDIVACQFSIDWLLGRRKNIRLESDYLITSERSVIRNMSYQVFRTRMADFIAREEHPMPPDDILQRLFDQLGEFRSWQDVLTLATSSGQSDAVPKATASIFTGILGQIPELRHSHSHKYFWESFAFQTGRESVPAACKQLRKALIGHESGPPLLCIVGILGVDEINRRLKNTGNKKR